MNNSKDPFRQVLPITKKYEQQKFYRDVLLNHLSIILISLKKYEAQLEQEIAQKKLSLKCFDIKPQLNDQIHTPKKVPFHQIDTFQQNSTIKKKPNPKKVPQHQIDTFQQNSTIKKKPNPKKVPQHQIDTFQQNSTIIKKPNEQKIHKKQPFDYNLLKVDQDDNIKQNIIESQSKIEKPLSPLKQEEQQIQVIKNDNINQNENIQRINQIEQLLEHYQLKIQFQYKEERLKKTIEKIKQLKELSQDKRNVEEQFKAYLQTVGNFNTLCKHYQIKNLDQKLKLKIHCNQILFVRGDGNCFYTAFMYQFLGHLLFTYSLEEYDQFIQFVLNQKIQFKINYNQFQIDDQDLLEEFFYQLQIIRLIEQEEDRRQQLLKDFVEYNIQEDGSGCFNSLSIIFLRNLCNFLLDFNQFKDQCKDRQNLLIWEEECNNNEIIIQTLAVQLKINVKLIFFQNGQFIVQDYENQHKNQILLLIQPGHYNIGFLELTKN